MQKPVAQILQNQKKSLRVVGRLVTDVDPDSLSPSEAVDLYALYVALERVAAAGRTMMLPLLGPTRGRTE